jgi:hypothetical protein
MASIITKKFSTELAQDFTYLFDIGANDYLPQAKKSYVYAVLGKQIPWNAGTEVVPTPTESIPSLNQCWDNAIIAKRMSLNDVSFVVARRNWALNVEYDTYDSGNANYYVLNSKDQVFKCLDNNGGAASTDEPQLFLSSTSLEEPYFQTTDGYKWKYMYTLNTSQKEKFLTAEWMPVTYNKFVRAAALDRSIDVVKVTNSGNNYVDGSTQSIITIVGDGSGAVLKANVSNGQIQNVIVQSRGLNYTKANLVFTDITGGNGTGARAVVSLAPQNGHGYDPIEELSANTIMLNIDFAGNESGDFPAENEFRQLSLLKNPYVFGTSTLASAQLYNIYTKVNVSPGIGDFNNDEYVYQGDTLETALFSAQVISFDELTNNLFLNNIVGTFQPNITIKGNLSGAIRVGVAKTDPELHLYSGKTLMIINQQPLTRDPDQTDRIKFILSF